MSIDKFLNDFEEQSEARKQQQKLAEEARQKREAEDADFLQEFNSYYIKDLTKALRVSKEKLKEKFDFTYDATTSVQQSNVYHAKIQISPKFETPIKTITISFICELGRRLITISGRAVDSRGNEIKNGIGSFQDSFEKFKELDIDTEIGKVLENYFIKK